MADGVTTRLQKEVTQLQKDLEKLETRIDVKLEKLGEKFQHDLQVGLQQGLASITAEMGNIIRQLIPRTEEGYSGQKISKVVNTGPAEQLQTSRAGSSGPPVSVVTGCKTNLESDSKTQSLFQDSIKFNSKRSKIECPRFDGNDFLGWYMKVEQYFDAVEIPAAEKVQTVMIHLDGKALQWHQRHMKTKGPLKDMSWPDYAGDMRARFHDTEFSDPMFELVSLKQSNSVEEYYEEFEALLNLL